MTYPLEQPLRLPTFFNLYLSFVFFSSFLYAKTYGKYVISILLLPTNLSFCCLMRIFRSFLLINNNIFVVYFEYGHIILKLLKNLGNEIDIRVVLLIIMGYEIVINIRF